MALPPSVYAEKDEGFVSFRSGLGMIFLGGSALMVKQGIDFRNEADDLYLRYQTAEIADKYEPTTENFAELLDEYVGDNADFEGRLIKGTVSILSLAGVEVP